ncbi:MAG: hypothetical protein MJ252_29775, partial [archaeon]|nr:hypothetical protein [archaeon]
MDYDVNLMNKTKESKKNSVKDSKIAKTESEEKKNETIQKTETVNKTDTMSREVEEYLNNDLLNDEILNGEVVRKINTTGTGNNNTERKEEEKEEEGELNSEQNEEDNDLKLKGENLNAEEFPNKNVDLLAEEGLDGGEVDLGINKEEEGNNEEFSE